jgi:hypothetical protein
MPDRSLDLFLQQQLAEGQQHDQGGFSIDATRAWELLSAQAQPFEQAWVCKLVQAACLAPCHQLRVTQLAEATTFAFEGASWTWSELNPALARLPSGRISALDHLATALRWLARGSARPFTLWLSDGQEVCWDGSVFEVVERGEQPTGLQPLLRVEHQTAEQKDSFLNRLTRPGVAFGTTIAEVLHRRAYTSSIPLFLDGWRVAGLLHDRRFYGRNAQPLQLTTSIPQPPLEAFFMPLVPDPERLKAQEGPTMALLGAPERPLEESFYGTVSLLLAYFGEEKVKRGFFTSRTEQKRLLPQRRSSYLLWVLDGVVIEEEVLKLKTPVGFVLAVSAAGLRTDLSGFGLIRDEAMLQRREAAFRELLEQLQRVAHDPAVRVDVEEQGKFRLKVQMATAVLVVFLCPPVGLLIGANAFRAAQQEAELERLMEQTYDSGLRELCIRVLALIHPTEGQSGGFGQSTFPGS